MFEIKKQDLSGRKTLGTLGDIKLACAELGISDDKHTLKRASRAFDLYYSEKVEHVNDHTFNVKSQYRERLPYQVWISPTGTSYCTCPDWRNYSGDSVVPDVHFHCKHSIAARIWLHHNGNGSKITSECGTSKAKELQDKLNSDNGTGDIKSPSHKLDVSNPFEESEQLDIDQIEGRSNGDLVHKLSNGKYVVSYHGIMKLAEQHSITFEAARHDETRTVIAYGRCGGNSRASGKPINGSEMTARELAKRNTARQLLPLVEIKALEKKAQLEAEFDWQKAKAKCLEIVPDFTFDILLNDLVRDGKIAQKHPSDYNRKEWLLIFDACKRDAETNGGGANTPLPTDKFTECRDAAKDFVRLNWLKSDMLKEGILSGDWTDDDFATLKEACEIDASLFGKELGHWMVEIQPNHAKWAYQRRWAFWLTPMSRRCFWCAETEGIMPDTFIHWGRYEIKSSLCLECSEKVGNGELDKDRIVQKFDEVYRAYGGVGRSNIFPDDAKTVPSTESEFVERCKQAETDVIDDNTDDNSVAELATAPMVEGAQMGGDEKRKKLQMDAKLRTWLVEADGTKKAISCREICEQFAGNIVMQLRAGIDSGGDISTVELDN